MGNENELPEEEKFSDDPEENLRMKNDFLKMKMMAESGAFFGGDGELPADIENQFLKDVLEFEKANAEGKSTSIFEILGKPFFEEERNLDEKQFELEFKRLNSELIKSGIHIEFKREREDRFKYNFITKELFEHETSMIPVEGMSTFFLYEEFHPDHELDLVDLTNQFLNDFFDRKLDNESFYISSQIIEPDGKIVLREEMIKRFQSMYEAIPEFEGTSFCIENQEFELNESDNGFSGMGFTEGTIDYELIFRDGDKKKINGPFKIYFSREWEYWSICFFYLAGFNLHPRKEGQD